MRISWRKPHLLTVFCAILIWLVAGIDLRVPLGTISDDLTIETTTVVASPGNSYQITEPVLLSSTPRVVVERGTLLLVDGTTGKPAQGADALVAVQKGWASLLLKGGSLRIGGGDSITRAHELDRPNGSRDPLREALEQRNFKSLFLSATSLVVKLPDHSEMVAKGAIGKFDFSRKDKVSGSGSANLRGVSVGFDIKVAPHVKRVENEANALALSVRLKSSLINAEFDGRLNAVSGLEMRGTGRVRSENLRGAVAWLAGGSAEGAGLKKFDVAGEAEWSQQAIAFDKATVKLDGNDATGALALNLAGGRPSITGTLALGTLDLTRYVLGDQLGNGSASGSQPRTAHGFDFSSLYVMPFQLPLGKQIDADVRLSASQVIVAGLHFGPSAATVALKQGRLLADVAQFAFAGGQGAGQLSADFSGYWPSFSFRGKLTKIDFSRSSLAPMSDKILQGETGITVDLSGRGATLTEVLRSMNGTLGVVSKAGGRIGLDVRGLMHETKSVPITGWSNGRTGTTAFDTLAASFVAQNGTLFAKKLEVVSGQAIWRGAGMISFSSNEIEMMIDQRTVGTSGPPRVAKELPRLEIRGPLAAPVIRSVLDKPGGASPVNEKNDRTDVKGVGNGAGKG